MAAGAGSHRELDENVDRELVCFTLTDRAGIFFGWVRHQDSITGPVSPGGVTLFAANAIPAVPAPTPPATTPAAAPAIARGDVINPDSYTLTNCVEDECCDTVLGDGCWDDGTASGRWVSVRDSDGNTTVLDPVTGNTVAPGDVVACDPPAAATSVQLVDGDSATDDDFTIPGGSDDLVAWSVRAKGDGVSVSVGTNTVTLDSGETLEASSPPDDGSILNDAVQVVAPAGVEAIVVYQRRA